MFRLFPNKYRNSVVARSSGGFVSLLTYAESVSSMRVTKLMRPIEASLYKQLAKHHLQCPYRTAEQLRDT